MAGPRDNRGSGRYPRYAPFWRHAARGRVWLAGALMHGTDYRRSSGGFVHGFRYLVRAQARHMLAAHFGTPWPAATLLGAAAAAAAVLARVQNASGLYQMFGELVDVIVPVTTLSTLARAPPRGASAGAGDCDRGPTREGAGRGAEEGGATAALLQLMRSRLNQSGAEGGQRADPSAEVRPPELLYLEEVPRRWAAEAVRRRLPGGAGEDPCRCELSFEFGRLPPAEQAGRDGGGGGWPWELAFSAARLGRSPSLFLYPKLMAVAQLVESARHPA